MDAKDYAIDNLIVKCSEKMNESGYSQGCISTHVVRWKLHLKPFLVKNGTSVYDSELGRRFLMEMLPSLSPASQRRFKRSVRIIDAFVTTGEIPKHAKRSTIPFFSNGIWTVAQDFIDYKLSVVSKKVCKVNIILIFALSNKQQQEYGTYTRTNFGNYFELHK